MGLPRFSCLATPAAPWRSFQSGPGSRAWSSASAASLARRSRSACSEQQEARGAFLISRQDAGAETGEAERCDVKIQAAERLKAVALPPPPYDARY